MLHNGGMAPCSCGECGGTAVGGTGGPVVTGYLILRHGLRHQDKVGQRGVGVRAGMTKTSFESGWFLQLCRRRLGSTQVRVE